MPRVEATANARRVCRTPEAQFHTRISPQKVEVVVDLAGTEVLLKLTEEQAKELENRLHDAVEGALAPFFQEADVKR